MINDQIVGANSSATTDWAYSNLGIQGPATTHVSWSGEGLCEKVKKEGERGHTIFGHNTITIDDDQYTVTAGSFSS